MVTLDKDKKPIAIVISIVILMELIDSSALNTALPQLAHSFMINPVHLKVAITVYMLTLGLFIPASVWVAERFGIRRILLISVLGFVVSSVGCGLSTSLWVLVLMRALQGFFAAFTTPVARLAMVKIFKGNMMAAMAMIAVVVSIGPMLGPVVGGVITTLISWRMIFFLNVPVGGMALIMLWRLFPVLETVAKKFDIIGFIQLSLAVVLFLLGLDIILSPRFELMWKIIAFSGAIILGGLYWRHTMKWQQSSVLNLMILKDRTLRYFVVVSIMFRFCLMGNMFLIPLYLQTTQGLSAMQSGLVLLAFVIPSWFIRRWARPILAYFHFYRFFMIVSSVSISVFVVNAYLFSHFVLNGFYLTLMVFGLTIGSFMMIANTGMYNAANDEQSGPISLLNSMLIPMIGAFSVTVVAIVLKIVSDGGQVMGYSSEIPSQAFSAVSLGFALLIGLGMLFIQRARPRQLETISIT